MTISDWTRTHKGHTLYVWYLWVYDMMTTPIRGWHLCSIIQDACSDAGHSVDLSLLNISWTMSHGHVLWPLCNTVLYILYLCNKALNVMWFCLPLPLVDSLSRPELGAQHRLPHKKVFPEQLRKFHLPRTMLVNFYTAIIESIITFAIIIILFPCSGSYARQRRWLAPLYLPLGPWLQVGFWGGPGRSWLTPHTQAIVFLLRSFQAGRCGH